MARPDEPSQVLSITRQFIEFQSVGPVSVVAMTAQTLFWAQEGLNCADWLSVYKHLHDAGLLVEGQGT
jgi:hypothetical protein